MITGPAKEAPRFFSSRLICRDKSDSAGTSSMVFQCPTMGFPSVMPEPGIEAAPFPSQRLHHSGIFSDRIDFEPVPDNSRILPQCFQFFIRHFRHLMYLKAVECLPVPFPSLQDRLPGQSGLRSFQCQHFKKILIIMTDSSPFGIVISLHKR